MLMVAGQAEIDVCIFFLSAFGLGLELYPFLYLHCAGHTRIAHTHMNTVVSELGDLDQ